MTFSRLITGLLLSVAISSTADERRNSLLIQPDDVIAVCAETPPQQKMLAVDIADYFLMCQPVKGVRVVNAGIHRESVENFMKRLKNDLAPLRPTVVLTCYGSGNGRENAQSRALSYYQPTYLTQAIEGVKALGVRTIVVGSSCCADSFYFHNNPADAATWNQNLAAFRDSDRQTAEKTGVLFADVYGAMMDVMPKAKAAFGEKYSFALTDAWDRFPGPNAQLVMAYAFLKTLGCDGAVGAITVDLASNQAEATTGHKIISIKDGAVEVESVRYPFCFSGKPDSHEATSGIIQFSPFNEELNRYLLIVKGLKTQKAKVTWGTESREFTAAELAKGVNLAAAFAAHTPFDAQFAKVEAAVWTRQEPEKLFMESYYHNIEDLKKMAPDRTANIEQLGAAIVAQERERNEAAAALVVPIRHTLKIEGIQ